MVLALESMCAASLVEKTVDDRWHLTEAGLRRIRPSFAPTGPPTQVFCLRPGNIAIQDRTAYELLLLLHAENWEWARWVPPKQRTRRMQIADAYRPGEPKVFYTGVKPDVKYMAVLLRFEELHQRGHEYVSAHVAVRPR